jgi:hypothetical protein
MTSKYRPKITFGEFERTGEKVFVAQLNTLIAPFCLEGLKITGICEDSRLVRTVDLL